MTSTPEPARQSARAIIVRDDALLVMKRNKFGDEYYTLVGGGVDPGEDYEQALYRELAEETGLVVANHRLVIIEDAGPYGMQHIFTCDYVSGEPQLAPDAFESTLNTQGQNTYEPLWLPIAELANVRFLPRELQQTLITGLAHGWPQQPLHLKIA